MARARGFARLVLRVVGCVLMRSLANWRMVLRLPCWWAVASSRVCKCLANKPKGKYK